VITRILYRLLRRRRRWTEPDTLTRLPLPNAAQPLPPVRPEAADDDELLVRARLFRLLGIGGPR
jgi:hypothetical protein